MTRIRRAAPTTLAVIAMGFSSCSPFTGRMIPVPRMGASRAVVRTEEPDGLRVLWNGHRRGPIHREAAWLASDARELAALWADSGLDPPPPRVAFDRYVALGVLSSDVPCPAEIERAVTDGRTVELLGPPQNQACEDVLVGVAQVVALPRRFLPEHLAFVPHWPDQLGCAYAFDVPATFPSRVGGPAEFEQGSGGATEAPRDLGASGSVALPEKGALTLRTLRDGTEVWVVHREDDSVTILSTAIPLRDEPGLSIPVSWDANHGRFYTGYDSHGRNVHGFPPMPAFSFRRRPGGQVEVLPWSTSDDAPVESGASAPRLEGDSTPYKSAAIAQRWSDIDDGRVARLRAAVVFSPDGPPRLCEPTGQPLEFGGCPPDAPIVTGVPAVHRAFVFIYFGPVVVHRRGDVADFVAVTGFSAYHSLRR